MKNWKHRGGVPEFLDFTIVDRDSWQEAKTRMTPTPDRIPWDTLRQDYRRWREEGYWISAALWFGFDVTHSWVVGTERVLLAMVEDPEWLVDMFHHFLDVNLALLDMIWEAGYTFDEITWPDAMFAEMERVIPVIKEDGGYIISSDHSVPDSVSLEQFRAFVDRAKELGKY